MSRAKTLEAGVLERFIGDTENHQLEVKRDDGLYKHLRVSTPGTRFYQYDLVTWPGYLCFCGDMGTLVFNREADMIAWFRSSPDQGYRINPDYVSQKVCDDGGRQVREWDRETFRDNVLLHTSPEWTGLDDETTAALRADVEADFLSWVDNPDEAYRAVSAYRFEDPDYGRFEFTDAWEWDNTQYTFRFIWALYAIAKGIALYDAHLTSEAVAEGRSAAIDAANAGA